MIIQYSLLKCRSQWLILSTLLIYFSLQELKAQDCEATSIVPYIFYNGQWQDGSTVDISPGDFVKLGPQPLRVGSWNWSGCGVEAGYTNREIALEPQYNCTITATYTNTCGAQSTIDFVINTGQEDPDAPAPDLRFLNGRMFSDDNGNLVRAHGPGVIKVDGTYYVIGEDRRNYYGFHAVNMYSTKDFVNWKFENEIITKATHPSLASGERFVERPKIIYNESTEEFVIWLHWEGYQYAPAEVAIFKSSAVNGDYEFVRAMRPNGQMARDCNLFVEDDGRAYFIAAGSNNATLYVHELTDDYLNVTGYYYPLFTNQYRESPVFFKENGLYYLICSGTTGWAPNRNLYSVSTSLKYGWSSFRPVANSTTFNSQSAHFVKVEGTTQNQYVYIGDRWQDPSNFTTKLVFAPIVLSNNGQDMRLQYAHEFEVDGVTGELRTVDSDDLVNKSGWSIEYASSTYESDVPENAIDGDPTTFWHSLAGHPHEFIVDMGVETSANGFEYVPRQDGELNGLGETFELYISNDVNDFGTPVAGGWIAQQGNVDFPEKSGRYAKFVSHTSYASRRSDNQKNRSGSFVTIAEFDLYTNGKCNVPIQGEYFINGVKGSNVAVNDTIQVSVTEQEALLLKPTATAGTGGEASGSVIWYGPNDYFDMTREFDTESRFVRYLSMDIEQSGHYLMIYQDEFGCSGSVVFDVTVESGCGTTEIIRPLYNTYNRWRSSGYGNINLLPDREILFAPQPTTGGSWSWVGPDGFTASTREISYTPTEEGSYTFTVTHTNECGAVSSPVDYIINVDASLDDPTCNPAIVVPFTNTGYGWFSATNVEVVPGDVLTFGPQEWNQSGGTWEWSGCGQTANTREWSFTPTENCTVTGTYTNSCGEQSVLTFNIIMEELLPNGVYHIVNGNSNLCLTNQNGNTANGTNVVQEVCDGSTDQEWTVTGVGSGRYSIVHRATGLFADISGASTRDGASNILWPDNGGANQEWNILPAMLDYYHIENVNSGLFLDIVNESRSAGAQNTQWSFNRGKNQDWSFELVETGGNSSARNANASSIKSQFENVLRVYPNPVNGEGTVEVAIPENFLNGELMLMNSQGGIIVNRKIDVTNFVMQLNAQGQGLYFLSVSDGKSQKVQKIVIK